MPSIWPTSLLFAGLGSTGKHEDTPENVQEKKSRPSPTSRTSSNSSSSSTSSGQVPVTDFLKHFEAPGVPPPPSSRVGDPTLKQRESQPIRLWHLWKHAAFVAWKATGVLTAAASHTLHGPPRKSWGIEMTILTAIMRDVNLHSHLADLPTIRMFMSISGLYPVPSDALITPVTFNVRSRDLRGILTEFDKAENGKRELSGEWVVGRRTWERLQAEWQAARRAKLGLKTPPKPQKRKERVVLYLHGGAYYLSSPATHRLITIPLSKALDARLFALDYRLAPETRFPGPLHDAVSAYFRMTDDLLIPAENIIVAGDSAGGGLTLALMMYLRDNGYPLPGAAILMSPWVDLTMSCDSWESNAPYDIVPKPLPGDHLNPIACYLGEHMEKYLTHPYASPLFGDFKGLPPLLIQSGEAEVLRDESTLMAHKATLAGVTVRHELYEDAVHVFQTFPFLEQAQQAFHSAREFVRETLKPLDGESPAHLESNVEEQLESEIDNEKAQVVQGDGSVSSSRKDELRDPEKANAEVSMPGEEDIPSHALTEGHADEDDDDQPSWVSKTPWPSPPLSPSDEKRLEFPRRNTAHAHGGSSGGLRSRTPSITSITSTILRMSPLSSPKIPFASPPIPPTHASSVPSTMRRARARSYLTLPSYHTTSNAPPTKDYFLPANANSSSSHTATTMSPAFSATAPRPSIRRSHSSHPDITVLCDQWARRGPANQTVTIKPDGSSSAGLSPSTSRLGDANGSEGVSGALGTGVGMRRKKARSGSVSSLSSIVVGGKW
ncbi:Alpha/Beta hydrolase protein [Irpex lacteus]|nr:Alpha/Beta hydrolase protein [Irpex lacteus]